MQLPIDIKAVLDESTNIDAARQVRLALTVYVDRSAPAPVADCVLAAFERQSPNACVSVQWIADEGFSVRAADDMACLVAGFCPRIGEYAEQLRAEGVPCMVATTMPNLVVEIAEGEGHPIPRGDVVAPDAPKRVELPGGADDADGSDGAVRGDAQPAVVSEEEPYDLTEEVAGELRLRMGQWIIAACHGMRLAFALAFPFVRKPLALDAVRSTALQNAGVGVFVFIPGADMPVMTLNQAKMLLMIAAAYGEEPGIARAKELAAVVGGAFACRAVARQLVSVVPGLGWAVKGAIGYAGTEAMGRAAIEYYENGASLGKLEDMAKQAAAKASKAAEGAAAFAKRGAKRAAGAIPAGVQAQAFSVFDTVRAKSQTIAGGVAGVASGVSAVAGGAASVAGGVARAAEGVRNVAANRFGSGVKGQVR